MGTKQRTEEIISNAVAALGYEYQGCDFISQPGHLLLRIYIDNVPTVTVGDCERASRQIGAALDVEQSISGKYVLEVSSPGLDRRLFNLAQCARFLGHMVKVRTRAPIEGQRNFSGILDKVTDGQIVLLVDGKEVNLNFDNVEKANLVPQFLKTRQ